jgi:hypothetical protein
MLIILAGEQDEVARELARRWSSWDCHLLTAKDLSRSGWRHWPGSRKARLQHAQEERPERPLPESDKQNVAVVGGAIVPTERIDGVLTRLPCVYEWELAHIVASDRAYVSAEMTAFLLSWLSELDCPILNRPTPTCLSGPGWRQEQWTHLAARLGIPVKSVKRYAKLGEEASVETGPDPCEAVIVVGQQCFNAREESQAVHAQNLAAAAGVGLLGVHFTIVNGGSSSLQSVESWPDVNSSEVAEAILNYFAEDLLED